MKINLRNIRYYNQTEVCHHIDSVSYIEHTVPLFKQLHIQNVHDICKLQMHKFMHAYTQSSLPDFLRDVFVLNADIHR